MQQSHVIGSLSGIANSKVVFNLPRALAAGKQSVVVVEGFFDCMKLHQAGVHAAVALMGSVLYELPQRALIQRFQRVVLMLDGDAAGRHATTDIAAQLRAYCSIKIVRLPEQRQPDQLSADEIRRALTLGRTADFMGPVQ